MPDLIYVPEPTLQFGYGQAVEDPRDGLSLFGPLDAGKPYGIRAGAIGTRDGLRRFRNWVDGLKGPIETDPPSAAMPVFPGFEAAFGIPWDSSATIEVEIPESELTDVMYLDDKHVRVYQTVNVYANRIIDAIRREDTSVDVWFVVIPSDVHRYGRPNSQVDPQQRVRTPDGLSVRYAKQLRNQRSLFQEDQFLAQPYYYEVHFHNQLKARLLGHNVPTQVVQESTLARYDFVDRYGRPTRQLEPESAVAWNLSTTTFYKSGGRPWKLSAVRPGVCYIGLTFKVDERSSDPRTACCAAQMFLDSGDGVVFRGAVGPWFNQHRGDFHLSRSGAKELVGIAIDSYKQRVGSPPAELFIHGRVRFNHEEWLGFTDGAGTTTKLVGVRIRESRDLKLYRKGNYPVLRGLAYVQDNRTAYLWTRGFVPRLQTYPGWEVPWPLYIDVCRGEADVRQVLQDVLSLTKLNYNRCIYGDGVPVTLRFSDAVGEILTAGPLESVVPPLAFKNYI